METPPQRVSDAEREAVVEHLRQAAGEGRLDPDELGERVERAYRAQTIDELEPLTADLPPLPVTKAAAMSIWHDEQVRNRLAALIIANPICIAVWLASGADGDFWPRWVLIGTAAALIATFVKTLLGVEHEDKRAIEPPPPPRLPHDR